MAIKVIAVDIDGTLTNDEKKITPRTKEALLAAQRAGIRVIIASGRPSQGLRALGRELELEKHHGMLVSFNGAHVEDAQTGEVLFDQPIPHDLLKPLLDHVRQFDVIPWVTEGRVLYVEDAYPGDIYHRGEPINIIKHERDACNLLVQEIGNLDERIEFPQDKVLLAGTDTYLAEHWQEISAPFEGKLAAMFTADFFFEFMAPGVSKGNALAGAMPKLGIDPSEVVTFGDAQNDLSMITWAGTGVAMGNATDEVKAAADMITLSNNEDGIAVALEQLLA